jgi:DNA-binding transcriptional LysR family regulator
MNAMECPMNRLPSLNALRTFEAAARHETLMQAAEELHVTHGAVSRQVRALEQDLGEELFERSGRGKVPTERGVFWPQGFRIFSTI